MKVGGIVVAGGKSQRLGYDKALETLDGVTLLERVVRRLSALSRSIIIVRDVRQPLPEFPAGLKVRVVPDIFPGKGSLGGIYTGLTASRFARNLVVACDMPFLNEGLLRYIVEASPGFDIVLPRVGDLIEPLHAVYARTCLAPMESLLNRGKLRIGGELLQSVRVRYLTEAEIDRFDPGHRSFFNINNQTDLATARRLEREERDAQAK